MLLEFFRSFPPFSNLPLCSLIELSNKCTLKSYHINDVVLKQGDEPNNVYFIKTGRFKVIRKVDFRKVNKKFPEALDWQYSNTTSFI
jgi:cAMP-dependent protein kinase regulator